MDSETSLDEDCKRTSEIYMPEWQQETTLIDFDSVKDVRVYVHGRCSYQLALDLFLEYVKKMKPDCLRKSDLHFRLEWEMLQEGVKHADFKNMLLDLSQDIKERLPMMGNIIAEYLDQLASRQNPPQKLAMPFGIFSMAYISCLFDIPRMYSGDNVPRLFATFRKLNVLQNRVSTGENGPRDNPKPTGKIELEKWICKVAYKTQGAVISVLIEEIKIVQGQVHFSLVLDRDCLLEIGKVDVLSFSYGIQYESVTIHLCGKKKKFRLPTALRRCWEYMQPAPFVWTDIFNDTFFKLRLEDVKMSWGELLCSIYRKNKTFKGGWHGRELSYFNRGWILQEFMCGLPIDAGSVFHECMGQLSNYEKNVQQMSPKHKLLWVTCWSCLLWYMDGLTNRLDAKDAFCGLLSADVGKYGVSVQNRIVEIWKRPSDKEMTSIRDAMMLVCEALGPDEFKLASLEVERILCEATMVLMASLARFPTFDADSKIDCPAFLNWAWTMMKDKPETYHDFVSLPRCR